MYRTAVPNVAGHTTKSTNTDTSRIQQAHLPDGLSLPSSVRIVQFARPAADRRSGNRFGGSEAAKDSSTEANSNVSRITKNTIEVGSLWYKKKPSWVVSVWKCIQNYQRYSQQVCDQKTVTAPSSQSQTFHVKVPDEPCWQD